MAKTHKLARRFEDRLAEDLGGRRIFLSGAGFDKGDIRVAKRYKRSESGDVETLDTLPLRVEAKTTNRSSFAFKLQDWLDINRTAAAAGEYPVFAVEFVEHDLACVVITSALYEVLGFSCGNCLPAAMGKQLTLNSRHLLEDRLRRHLTVTWQMNQGATLQKQHLIILNYDRFLAAMENHAHR